MAQAKRERLIDFNEFIAPHGLDDCFEIFRLNHGNRIKSVSFWGGEGGYYWRIFFSEAEPLDEGFQVTVTTNDYWFKSWYSIQLFLFSIDESHTLVLRHRETSHSLGWLFITLSIIAFLFIWSDIGFSGAIGIMIYAIIMTSIGYYFRIWRTLNQLEKEIRYLLIDKRYPE